MNGGNSHLNLVLMTLALTVCVYIFQLIVYILIPTSSSECDESLWKYVYKAQRFKIQDKCTVVTGIIKSIKKEKDGDYQINLQVDEEYKNFINTENTKKQKGQLVLKAVCQIPISPDVTNSACHTLAPKLVLPSIGSHVRVAGTHVLNSDRGWMELRPITSLTEFSSPSYGTFKK